MKPTPKGWPRISSALYYEDAHKAIDWLCNAFAFTVRIKVEGDAGEVHHAELVYGDGVIMIAESGKTLPEEREVTIGRAPSVMHGSNSQSLMVYVDDVDAHCAHARAAGATIAQEPALHDYGEAHWADRSYGAIDVGGHRWWFSQRVRG